MQQLSVLATMGDVENTRALFDADDQRDPNERVECDGSTPLILAADKKHVEIVKVLLEHGADCTLTNNVSVIILCRTINLFIFAAIYFRIMPMECQFAEINFLVSLACLISYNESIKFSRRFIFAI